MNFTHTIDMEVNDLENLNEDVNLSKLFAYLVRDKLFESTGFHFMYVKQETDTSCFVTILKLFLFLQLVLKMLRQFEIRDLVTVFIALRIHKKKKRKKNPLFKTFNTATGKIWSVLL